MAGQSFDLRRSGPWIGVGAMVSVLFLYGASALVAPAWAVAALLVVWLVLFVLALRWFATRPLWVLALPVLAVLVWFVALVAGGAFLGWHPG